MTTDLGERHNKVWGHEIWLVNTRQYCCKHLHIKQGAYCSFHYHKKKDETFIVLEGRVEFVYTDDSADCMWRRWANNHLLRNYKTITDKLSPGARLHIPPYRIHSFEGLKDSLVLEVSTHHRDDDSYRITTSGRRSAT